MNKTFVKTQNVRNFIGLIENLQNKDFLQLYCEIVSTNELLEKLPPEKVNIIFDKLSENDKIKLVDGLRNVRECIQEFTQIFKTHS